MRGTELRTARGGSAIFDQLASAPARCESIRRAIPVASACGGVDFYALIAAVLWTVFGLSLVASTAGVLLVLRQRRQPALVALFCAVVGLLAFSMIAGFSIGRFTCAIPVLLIGSAIGAGRGPAVLGASMIGSVLVYLAFSWWLTPLLFFGGVFSIVFGSWGITFYALLAIGAFGWAALSPPRVAQPFSV